MTGTSPRDRRAPTLWYKGGGHAPEPAPMTLTRRLPKAPPRCDPL